MITQRDIKNTYYDALFFASSTTNEKKDFFLRGAEFRILLKLIHYSSNEENITWSSENISKHLTTSVDSIDKNIQRLRQKGYINVINQQRGGTNRKRTIYINWEFILEIDGLYQDHIKSLNEQQNSIQSKVNEIEETTIQKESIVEDEIINDEVIQEDEVKETSVAYFLSQLPKMTDIELEVKNIEPTKDELIEAIKIYNLDKTEQKIILKNIQDGRIKTNDDIKESITLLQVLR